MPQNKSTSRIAAITGKLAVALAALLAPAILIAETTTVTFDAALTNETGWVYNDVDTNKDGNICFKLSSSVQSPTFPFNITSIEITLSCSSTEPTRYLQVILSSGDATNAASVVKASTKETQIFEFDKTDTARSFSIRLTGSNNTGKWYIYSAVISGVPIIDAPTNLQADDIKGTRFRLSWTNPENAVSNRIAVSHIKAFAESGRILDSYDFMSLTNTSKNANDNGVYDKSTLQMIDYPAFSGTNIYAAGFSTGVVQISSSDHQGYLRYDFTSIRDALEEAANVSMLVSTKRHSTDVTGTGIWNLEVTQFDDDDTASQTTNVVLGFEFPQSPCAIQIKDPAACKSVTLRPSGTTAGNRRILIDYLAFIRDYSPASISTNLVQTVFTTGSPMTMRRLSPSADYLVTVTAFDAEGNESSPSEPLAVTTNGEAIPFSIRIQ